MTLSVILPSDFRYTSLPTKITSRVRAVKKVSGFQETGTKVSHPPLRECLKRDGKRPLVLFKYRNDKPKAIFRLIILTLQAVT